MIDKMLTAAGITHRQGRFPEPPAETYAVYFDDITRDGADPVEPVASTRLPGIYHHDARVEIYEPRPDPEAEAAFEDQLDAAGLDWDKEDRVWLQDVRRYQVLYTFTFTNKRRT